MNTWKHLIYMVFDELKGFSDDFSYTEDHISFLLTKYRGTLLKQQYKDIKKEIPESNFQTICIDLIEVPAISSELCEGGTYMRSKQKIPNAMSIVSPRIFAEDYYQGEITYVSRERMRYVGYNRWLPNIVYCSLGPDGYLYFKTSNPQFNYLEKARITGVFENPEEASKLECNSEDSKCDILDKEFPIEEALVPQLIQLVVKELSGAVYRPKDTINSASDDLATMAQYLRNNMKSNFQKQIDGD